MVNDQGFVMLLSEAFFKTFTKREVCDTMKRTESLLAFSCGSFDDLDGHHWEVFWMDSPRDAA